MVVIEDEEILRDGRVDNVSVHAVDEGGRLFAECCITHGVSHEVELGRMREGKMVPQVYLYYRWCLKTGKCLSRFKTPEIARVWEDP